MIPEDKDRLFHEFNNYVEGCAPDMFAGMYFDPDTPYDSKCWEVDDQKDLLVGSFTAYDEEVEELWRILNWEERRALVHEWGETAEPLYP